MATYEGCWDCPNCKKVGNRGPDKHCGGCGRARGEEVEFYLPDNAREVTDEAELSQAQRGPDWTCAYCQGDSPDDYKFCASCGAGKDGSKPRQVTEERFQKEAPAVESSGGNRFLKGVLGCLGVLVLVFLVSSWLFRPRDAHLSVTGHSWKRTIQTEELREVQKEAWRGEEPSGARISRSSREVHHVDKIPDGSVTKTREVRKKVQSGTEKVKVGRKNKGNGYFEDIYETRPVYKEVVNQESYQETVYRERPVYRDKLYFRVDEWVAADLLSAQGDDANPSWPPAPNGNKRRAGKRDEDYTVKLKDGKGKNYTYVTKNEAEWKGFVDGQSYAAKVSGDRCVSLGK